MTGESAVVNSSNATCILPSLHDYAPGEQAGVTILLLFIVLGTVFGNILVFLTLLLVKKLRTPSNLLLLSLSVSDLSIALTVEPFALYKTVNVFWDLSPALCQIYLFLDVMLCTASILNLNVITIDRYLVITRPFQYSVRRTPRLMATFIACVWLLSIAVSSAAFAWPRSEFAAGDCYYTQALSYQMYATVAAFYLPLGLMLILWARIFLIARRMANADRVQTFRVQNNATISQSPAPIELRVASNNHTEHLFVSDSADQCATLALIPQLSTGQNGSELNEVNDHQTSALLDDRDGTLERERRNSCPAMHGGPPTGLLGQVSYTKHSVSPCHHPPHLHSSHAMATGASPAISTFAVALSSDEHLDEVNLNMNVNLNVNINANGYAKKWPLQQNFDSKASPCLQRARPSATLSLLSAVTPTKRKATTSENKALVTIATIMTCFTLCWLPFFLYAFINPIYAWLSGCEIDIGHHGRTLLLWLGYANSFMNPIIYCKFNRDFRRPFIEFLKCHCRDVNARLRIEQYAEQYGVGPAVSSPSIHKVGLTNSAVTSPAASARLTRKIRNRKLLDSSLTRKQAEEAGLLTPSTRRSKIPKEHLLIVHRCTTKLESGDTNDDLFMSQPCDSVIENPINFASH